MLLQLLANHPEAMARILRNTPVWVWGLLTGLVALGINQLRDRTVGLARVSVLPVAMTVFSLLGTLSDFGRSPQLATAVTAWLIAAAMSFALIAPGRAAAQFDPVQRAFRIPGSVGPLLLILGIFLVKYWVGVELAMAPQLARHTLYALSVAALSGAFSGVFVGRAARLWRLAFPRRANVIPA